MRSGYYHSILLLSVMIGLPVDLAAPQPQSWHSHSNQILIERKPIKGRSHGLTVELFSFGRDKIPQDLVSEFLLTDPQGRRTGTDPMAQTKYREIPRSSYGQGDVDDPMKELDIREPLDGSYLLHVIGTARGPYTLSVRPQDEEAHSPNQLVFDNIPTTRGVIHAYRLQYTRTPGIPLKVTGGFDGGGEGPTDMSNFLTYANPIAAQTTLQAGKTPFPLILFYGATIDPVSFKAKLDRVDISRRFKPVPGGYQVIPLKFSVGSHTLMLSVQGKRAGGQAATDTDRLAFSVR
jgi:hypothetical protein